MRVLITGVNGLLGQKLTHLLAKKTELDVYVTGRGPYRNQLLASKYHNCELSDNEQVSQLFKYAKPEYVIHCAAMTQVDECEIHPEKCWRANVTATQNLIEESKKYRARFLFISTDFVFDGVKGNYKEIDQPAPISKYGESKWEAEKLITTSDLDWSIVRTVLVYGYVGGMSRSNLVLWVKKSLEENKTIQVVTDQIRTPTLVEDLAWGCELVVRNKATGLYHLSGEEIMTPYDMAIEIARYFKLNEELIKPVDASEFTQAGKRPPITGFDISKAKTTLGFRPTPFAKGLELIKNQLE